jgi:hypothetical protein
MNTVSELRWQIGYRPDDSRLISLSPESNQMFFIGDGLTGDTPAACRHFMFWQGDFAASRYPRCVLWQGQLPLGQLRYFRGYGHHGDRLAQCKPVQLHMELSRKADAFARASSIAAMFPYLSRVGNYGFSRISHLLVWKQLIWHGAPKEDYVTTGAANEFGALQRIAGLSARLRGHELGE